MCKAVCGSRVREKETMDKYILSMDQGTTSSRCILFDKSGNNVSMVQKEFKQIYPKPGWVEHDPMEIWATQIGVATEAMAKVGATYKDIASIGITNQRETTILWNKNTGKPIHNAIVWQCRRTSDMCENLKENEKFSEEIKNKTGLLIDSYFSATKIKWILDNVEGARSLAEKGDLLFGTVETWLIWNLTGGKVHVTDYSNASRTMLFNINTLEWDKNILKILDIPFSILPQVKPSSYIYGETEEHFFGKAIKIAGAAGDQQAALFGQTCFKKNQGKNTYGTGCFLLVNTGETPIFSKNGLLTTIAWGIDGKINYALEGSVFVGGATIQWLRDELGMIDVAANSEKIATKVKDTNGIVLIPAFVGMGAPYWDSSARGTIFGLTRGANKAHIVRAALESIALQSMDLIEAMEEDTGEKVVLLNVDGGACANNFLMQFQADILNINVARPKSVESTSLGAAYLAGLAVGFWKNPEDLIKKHTIERVFKPSMDEVARKEKRALWLKGIKCAMTWGKEL